MEILINGNYGGFGFSDRTIDLYRVRTIKEASIYLDWDELRTDPVMISIVKELGKEENPDLVIQTIRPGYESFYKIHEYDGAESITYDEAAYALSQLRSKLRTIAKDPSRSEAERLAAIVALLDG